MAAFQKTNRWWRVVGVGVLIVVGAGSVGVHATEGEIPEADQAAIEVMLDIHVRKLADERNEAGQKYRRGSFENLFRKTEGGDYLAIVFEDTAGPDQIKVERFVVTIGKEDNKWKIKSKELRDSWDGLYRSVLDDEDWYAFDSFHFEREGLKITGGKGYLFRDFFMGEVDSWGLATEDLKYEYVPPADAGPTKSAVWEIWQQLEPRYTDFDPRAVQMQCTPAECKQLWEETLTNARPVDRAEVDSRLVSMYEKEHVKRWKDALNDDPFSGFQRPPRPESAFWSVAFENRGEDLWAWMRYATPSIHEIAIGLGRASLFTYNDEATRKSGIDPIEIERRVEGHSRRMDLHSVKGSVDLAVLDAESIQGDLWLGFEIKEDRQTLPFYIEQPRNRTRGQRASKDPSLFINLLEDADGNRWSWTRTGPSSGLIIFPEELKAGSKVDLRIAFDSRETITKLNPHFSYVPRGAWMPLVDLNDLIEEFDLTVRVPDRYSTIAIGNKVSEKVEGGLNVTRWQNDFLISFPTVIFGDYLDDKPRSKATREDGSEIPIHIYVDRTAASPVTAIKTREDIEDYRIDIAAGRFGVRPSQLRPLAEQAVNALNVYREVWGLEYPYGQLDLVNSPAQTGSGQSPCTIVYLSSDAFRGDAELAQLYGETRFFRTLVAHEVGHQWWGGLINNLNQYNYWFIESLAEYSSALWLEAVESNGGKNPAKGYKEYLKQVEDWRKSVLRSGTTGSVQESDMARSPTDVGNARQTLTYFKGAFAFHMLRQLVGDEATWKLFQDMGREFKGKQIVTRDIQRVAEESLGRPMGWFFDQWIRGTGLPEYRLEYRTREAEDRTWVVEGKVEQRLVVGTGNHKRVVDGAFLAKVPITVTGKDGNEYTHVLYLREAKTSFAFKVPAEPRDVELNKNYDTLAHDVVTNEPWDDLGG